MRQIAALCGLLVIMLSLPALAFSPSPQPWATVTSVAFSPDSKALVSTGWDGAVRLWNVANGSQVSIIHKHGRTVRYAAFDASGETIVSAGGDGAICTYDTKGKATKTFPASMNIVDASLSPAGDAIALATGTSIDVWEIATGKLQHSMEIDSLCVDFSDDGKLIASGGWSGNMTLWNVADSKNLHDVRVNRMDLRNVDVSPDGQMVACGGWSDTVTLLDARTGTITKTLQLTEMGPVPVRFSPQSDTLAVGGTNGWIKLFDPSTGQVTSGWKAQTKDITSLAFSPDGATLATGSDDGSIALWNAKTGKLLHRLVGHRAKLWQ